MKKRKLHVLLMRKKRLSALNHRTSGTPFDIDYPYASQACGLFPFMMVSVLTIMLTTTIMLTAPTTCPS